MGSSTLSSELALTKAACATSAYTGSIQIIFKLPSPWFLVKVKVAQLCLTLCDPMDYTVHGILQARMLEWVAYPFSRGSSQLRDRTQVSRIGVRLFTSGATRALDFWYSKANSGHASFPTTLLSSRFFFLKMKNVYFLNEEILEFNIKTAFCIILKVNTREKL